MPPEQLAATLYKLWGEDDALISSIYAKEFADRIANSRIEIIKDCGAA